MTEMTSDIAKNDAAAAAQIAAENETATSVAAMKLAMFTTPDEPDTIIK